MNRLMKRNLAAKLISVFFALILWLYVMSVVNPRITREEMNIPVQLMNETVVQQEGLVVRGDPDPTVRVRLTGNRDQVHRVDRDKIDARADLRGHPEGTSSIPVEVTAPGNVDVDWSPQYITIELEKVIRAQMDIDVEIEGRPADGYVLGDPQLRPDMVWIEGPESKVNMVDRVVAQLMLDNHDENLSLSLPLRAVDHQGEEVDRIDVRTDYVDVFAPIDQLKAVGVDLDLQTEAAEGYVVTNVTQRPRTVTLRGQRNVLAEVGRVSTEPVILDGLTESRDLEVPIVFPDEVTPFDDQRVTVNIEVEAVREEVYELSRDVLRVINVEEGLTLDRDSLPETMNVTVLATESAHEAMDPSMVRLFLDMDQKEAGTHTFEQPQISFPPGVEEGVQSSQLSPDVLNVRLLDPDD